MAGNDSVVLKTALAKVKEKSKDLLVQPTFQKARNRKWAK